jgi:hypothetical protein
MVYNLVIKVASDSVDSFILLLAQIAIVMSTFSAGVSIVFLIDFFKRHGWTYKHKKLKKNLIKDSDPHTPSPKR